MSKKWMRGEFGMKKRTSDVYHLLADHFPKLFPRLTRLRKTYAIHDALPRKPKQFETVRIEVQRGESIWDAMDVISGNRGMDISISHPTEWSERLERLVPNRDIVEIRYEKESPNWKEDSLEYSMLQQKRESQINTNNVNAPFNRKAKEEI